MQGEIMERGKAGRRPVILLLAPPRTPAATKNQRREGGATMRASARFGVREAPVFQGISRGREAAARGKIPDRAASRFVRSSD
jgi:hypothetical protein